MLKNNRIRLRAVEPEDLDLMYLIENDTELWPNGQTTVPFSYYTLTKYLAENSHDIYQDRQLRLVIELADGISVGFVDLQHYEPRHHRAEVGVVVVLEQQRKGLATEALHLLSGYASAHLGIHQLYAFVPEDNAASIALFLKCGYEKTATLKDWLVTPAGWQSVMVFQLVV